jgi:hypothetical protein
VSLVEKYTCRLAHSLVHLIMLHVTSSTNIASLMAWKGHQDRFSRIVQRNVNRLKEDVHVAFWNKDKIPELQQYLGQQVDNWRWKSQHTRLKDPENTRLFLEFLAENKRTVDTCYDPNTVVDMDIAMHMELRELDRAIERAGGKPDDRERIQTEARQKWVDARNNEPLFAVAWHVYLTYRSLMDTDLKTSDDDEDVEEMSTLPMQPETPPVHPTTGQVRDLGVIVKWHAPYDDLPPWTLVQSVWKPEAHGVMTRAQQFLARLNDDDYRCSEAQRHWRLWSLDDVYSGLRMIFLCFWTWTMAEYHTALGRFPPRPRSSGMDEQPKTTVEEHQIESFGIHSSLKAHAHVSGLVTAMLAYLSVLVNPQWDIKPSRARTVAAAVARLVLECDNELRDENGKYAEVLDAYESQESGLPPVDEVNQVVKLLHGSFGGSIPLFRSTGWLSQEEQVKIEAAETILDGTQLDHRSLARLKRWKEEKPLEAKQSIEDADKWNAKRVTPARRQQPIDDRMSDDQRHSVSSASVAAVQLLRGHCEWLAWLFTLIDTRNRSAIDRTLEFLLSTSQEQSTLLRELCLHGQKAMTRYDKDRWTVKPLFELNRT